MRSIELNVQLYLIIGNIYLYLMLQKNICSGIQRDGRHFQGGG